MSIVSYNGITLPYAFTTNFSQEAVYDESGTDWCGTKFVIQVQSLLKPDWIDTIAPTLGVSPTNTAELMKTLRVYLLQPRRTLSYVFNGEELIPTQAGVPGTVDIRNGPKPRDCVIAKMTNATFLIRYSIEAVYWEKFDSNNISNNRPGSPVVSNRWTETVDINDCEFSRRTRDGVYVIRSDNLQGAQADEVRSDFAVVGVPTGFLRESSHYTISPDGLSVRYRVVDKEVFKMPPSPAFKATGEYVESTTNLGAVTYGEVSLRLEGTKTTPQAELVDLAARIAATKLEINGAEGSTTGSGFGLLQYAYVRVGMYENWVEVRMKCMLTAKKPRLNGVASWAEPNNYIIPMVFTPFSEGNVPRPAYKDRGTSQILLQAAAYYDPSFAGNALGAGDVGANDNPITTTLDSQMNNGKPVGTAGIDPET